MRDLRPKVLIAEDHTLFAELCKELLESEFNVVGIVHNGRDLIRSAVELRPDVAVVDISMPILNGLDAGQRVKEMLPNVKLVFLTMDPSEEVAAEAMLRGASGYVVKTCAASELMVAVRSAMRGEFYTCSAISKDGVNDLVWKHMREKKQQHNLSPRQREVLQLIAEGRQMKEVADILNITSRTATFHKYRIMAMVGAHSNAELVRYALKNHLVSA
jgi:DNA-binding NarL/FixJ family response regulator